MSQQITIESLQARLRDVTDERDHYKRELGMLRDDSRLPAMQLRFGLTRKEAVLLDTLRSRPNARMGKNALFVAVWGDDSDCELKILAVFICKLRAKIGKDKIQTIWGWGYGLSDAGRALFVGADA